MAKFTIKVLDESGDSVKLAEVTSAIVTAVRKLDDVIFRVVPKSIAGNVRPAPAMDELHASDVMDVLDAMDAMDELTRLTEELGLYDEFEHLSGAMCKGLGVDPEMLDGDTSYSTTSVSERLWKRECGLNHIEERRKKSSERLERLLTPITDAEWESSPKADHDLMEKIMSGRHYVSMGCKVEEPECSVCEDEKSYTNELSHTIGRPVDYTPGSVCKGEAYTGAQGVFCETPGTEENWEFTKYKTIDKHMTERPGDGIRLVLQRNDLRSDTRDKKYEDIDIRDFNLPKHTIEKMPRIEFHQNGFVRVLKDRNS